MIILGIETSCDETAAAIVEISSNNKTVLASVVASSEELHEKTGGIIPESAAREQVNSILPVINECFKIASSQAPRNDKSVIASEVWRSIDAIAVTYGPGLIGSLLVGVETAKTLALVWDKPIIPVNHLQAHLYACFLKEAPEFPAIGLVVSGGHSDFVYMTRSASSGQDIKVKYIGGTRDDAAGEAFDKTARILGLPYPGGPSISKEAEKYSGGKLDLFPRPMVDQDNLDLSFSGLKTAVINYTKKNTNYDVSHLSAEIQEAIVDTLVKKSLKAINIYKPKSFLLSGGVSANSRLKEVMKLSLQIKAKSTKFYVPEAKYSTDNAVMISLAAYYMQDFTSWQNVNANPSLAIQD